MKLVTPDTLKLYPKEHARLFNTGPMTVNVGGGAGGIQMAPYHSFRVEEDEILLECGLYNGHTSNDDAGYILEGMQSIADCPGYTITELYESVNPNIFAIKDVHDHNYTVGAAGAYQKYFDAWKKIVYNGFLWLWEEDDRIFLNYGYHTDCTAEVAINLFFYILTGQKK